VEGEGRSSEFAEERVSKNVEPWTGDQDMLGGVNLIEGADRAGRGGGFANTVEVAVERNVTGASLDEKGGMVM
jgi:hypothetical protein